MGRILGGVVAVGLWMMSAAVGRAQQVPVGPTVGSGLRFDVASVRQNKSDGDSHSNFSLDSGNIYSTVGTGDVFEPSGGYFSATNFALWRYIVFAYKLSGTQELALRFGYFTGLPTKAPAWAVGGFDTPPERFDIEARTDGNPTKDQMRVMMQALLAERFKLVVHHEEREAPVLRLVLVKPGTLGPQLQAHATGDGCERGTGASRASGVGELPVVCGVIAKVALAAGGSHYGGRGVTLGLLASSLPTMTGLGTLPRPVVDATGLSGTFDFTLGGWASQPAVEAGEPGKTFGEALKEQLGMKVEPGKGMVDVLVIDHVERPSGN